MRTHGEIKKGLECDNCRLCPYSEHNNEDGINHCWEVEGEALDFIQQLEVKNTELLEAVERLKAERDALVDALERGDVCSVCKYKELDEDQQPCATCGGGRSCWKWYGEQKTDGGQKDETN